MKNYLLTIYTGCRLSQLVLSLFVFSLPCFAFAQLPAIANAGFEQWTSVTGPDTFLSYSTSNGMSHFLTGKAAVWSVPGRTGKAVHLQAREADSTLVIPGSIALGTFCNGFISEGMHYPYSPNRLSFWARYDIHPNDVGYFLVMYKGGGQDSMVSFRSFRGSQPTWQQISLTLPSRPAGFDSITFVAWSSDPNAGVDGSWLELDDMELTGGGGPGLPNGGFEICANVGFEEPVGWGTPNVPSTWFDFIQSVTQTTDAAEGNFAIRLETTPFEFDCSLDTIGSLNSGGNHNGDFTRPYAVDQFTFPFHIKGKYTYTTSGLDEAAVVFLFDKYDANGNANLVQIVGKTLSPAASYTDFELTVDTVGWGVVPDSFHVIFAPSLAVLTGEGSSQLGSALQLDGLSFEEGYVTGAEAQHEQIPFSIYPNPAKDYATVEWEGTAGENCQISLLDAQGRLQKTFETDGSNEARLNLNGLASGMYLVVLKNEKGQRSIKQIIVE
ncbi:MAG: T9SS type A sorting domain-containing protein [Bacteroidia bacterium]